MKKTFNRKMAFTLIELLVVVGVVGLLTAMILPALALSGAKSNRIICANNLKETYLSFKIWEGDNNDNMPMAISTVSGGAEEAIYSYQGPHGTASVGGSLYGWTMAAGVGYSAEVPGPYYVFQTCSNQLATPKILYCPSDNTPTVCRANGETPTVHQNYYATDFNYGAFSDAYVSYFVCGEANEAYPGMVIFGDRNLSSIGVTANEPTVATSMMPPGTPSDSEVGFAYNTATANWAWTAQDLHLGAGNLALTDGSVSQVTVSGMRQAMISSVNGLPTGATMCSYNFP